MLLGKFFQAQSLQIISSTLNSLGASYGNEWDCFLLEALYRLHDLPSKKIHLSLTDFQYFNDVNLNKSYIECCFYGSFYYNLSNTPFDKALRYCHRIEVTNGPQPGYYDIYLRLFSLDNWSRNTFAGIIYLMLLIKCINEGSKIHQLILIEVLSKHRPYSGNALEEHLVRCILSDAFKKVVPLLNTFLQEMRMPTQRDADFYAWLHQFIPETKPQPILNNNTVTERLWWDLFGWFEAPTSSASSTLESAEDAYRRWLVGQADKLKRNDTNLPKELISCYIFELLKGDETPGKNSINSPGNIGKWFILLDDFCIEAGIKSPLKIRNFDINYFNNYRIPPVPSFKNVVRTPDIGLSDSVLPWPVINVVQLTPVIKPEINTLINAASTSVSAMASLIRVLNVGQYLIFSGGSNVLLFRAVVGLKDQQNIRAEFTHQEDKNFFLRQLQFHKNLLSIYQQAAYTIWTQWKRVQSKKNNDQGQPENTEMVVVQRALRHFRFHQARKLDDAFKKCELLPFSLVSTPGIESLQDYAEQLSAENANFTEFLSNVKSLISGVMQSPLGKCFISYAWEPQGSDPRENIALQSFLKRLQEDLKQLGFTDVFLDLTNMHGTMVDCMKKNIDESQVILLIGTLQLKQRVAAQKGGAFVEFQAIAERLNSPQPPIFIPLLLQGELSTSFPSEVNSTLSLDCTKSYAYFDWMTQLAPLGLIPTILNAIAQNNNYQLFYNIALQNLKHTISTAPTITSNLMEVFRGLSLTKTHELHAYKMAIKKCSIPFDSVNLCCVNESNNCFFDAVSIQLVQLGLPDRDPTTLREAAVKYLEEHEDLQKGFGRNTRGLHDYCTKMRRDGAKADELIIKAMSLYLDIQIIIVDYVHDPRTAFTIPFNESGKKTLYLVKTLKNGAGHYDALEPAVGSGNTKKAYDSMRPRYFK